MSEREKKNKKECCSTCKFFLSLDKIKNEMPSFVGTCVNCKSKYCTVFHKPYNGREVSCEEYVFKFKKVTVNG